MEHILRILLNHNGGFLNRGNLPLIETGLRALPVGTAVLEIGSCVGLSLNVMTHYLQRANRNEPVFSCDPWRYAASPDALVEGSNITWAQFRDHVRETFKRNVQFFSQHHLPHSFEMTSDDFFATWSRGGVARDVFGSEAPMGGPLGFCYIDGSHEYEWVRRDFENCERYLVPAGHLLFDDSGDDMIFEDVKRVVREARATGRYEVVASDPCYLLRRK